MDLALIASAGLMGLVGAPHCAAMCGAPCAALAPSGGRHRPRASLAGFMGGRMAGYMAGGAAVSAGVAVFSAVGTLAPSLRPLWTVAHLATLALGAWMLILGRLPGWFGWFGSAGGSTPTQVAAPAWQPLAGPKAHGVRAALRVVQAGAVGTLWLAMPCGLLQSALVVAALASTPWQGAAAMGAFAASSSLGLAAWPALGLHGGVGERAVARVVRASGALLVLASGFALGHGLWQRVAALCGVA